MATVKIFRRLVPKNPFNEYEQGLVEIPDEEEVLNVMDFNDFNFLVLSWIPPACTCDGCLDADADVEGA